MTDGPDHSVAVTADRFVSLGLGDELLNALRGVGFEHPTPIQAAVIPTALRGRDLLALSSPGTGRTTAFVLPIAERLRHEQGPQALILSPNREMALKTEAFFRLFGASHRLTTLCFPGEVAWTPEPRPVVQSPDVVVGTAEPLLDHLKRGVLRLGNVKILVIDGADQIAAGVFPELRRIVGLLPPDRHIMMFSATMPLPVEELARSILRFPERIDVLPKGRVPGALKHHLYVVRPEDKRACLTALIGQQAGSTVILARRNADAEWLFHELELAGHEVARMHSERTQRRREQAVERFRDGAHRILVTTHAAGRGIDVPGATHVINFDAPESVEDYPRGGRGERPDSMSVVSTIATWHDLPVVREIETALGQKLTRCSLPGVQRWLESKPKSRSK